MQKEEYVSKELTKEYLDALANQQNGCNEPMNRFKANHKEEYKLITTQYRRRTDLNDTLKVMDMLNDCIYWFTLTFKNSKDKNSVNSKRQEAQRFLNRICSVYVMVEEFGEDKGRYHVHGFLCFRYGYGFEDFRQWHSRQKLEALENNAKKKIRYLTDYSIKQAPRLRRSKSLSVLYTYYKKKKRMSKIFPKAFMADFKKQLDNRFIPF